MSGMAEMSKPIKRENGVECYADGTILLLRYPKRHRENYALNVTKGVCTWRGYKPEPIKEK